MICPRCGSESPPTTARCPRCASPFAPSVATGVLTPPPTADDAQTQFIDPRAPTLRGDQPVPPEVLTAPPSVDDAQTRFGDAIAPTEVARPASDADQTRFINPSASTALRESTAGEDSPTAFIGASTIGHAARKGSSTVNGPLQPGQVFGTRYQIIRTLGIGGMGAVYEAWDAELGVTVALKVIRPEVLADPVAAAEIERRFKRELLLARQVTHKNVVRIHDLGDLDGLKFITMSYVDGADLATILKRDGKLPVARVVRIARSVVSGLVEAHKQGVVHRDLKPANIMITAEDDDAMIMDFGIARSTGGSTARTGQTSVGAVPGPSTIVKNLGRGPLSPTSETVFGAVLGTVEYMAPEQAQGRPVDQRADVYAFGLILYDLLTGEPRSAKALSPILELQGRMQKAPPAIETIVPDVPEPVGQIIGRCLEPDPDKRFQTSEEVSAALALLDENGLPIPIPPRFSKTTIAAAAVAVIVLVTGTWWFTRTPPPPKQHDPVSVLIADFENKTGDPTFDHTLEPVLKLALEGAGFVSAYDRTSVRALGQRAGEKFDERAAVEMAAKAGLGVVMTGTLERQGSGFGIAVKAARTVTGEVVANGSAKAAGKDKVLEVATGLAATVRKALGDETSSDSAQMFAMASLSATSLDVLRHYAAAREASANGKLDDALRNYQKAVELDPKFGIGYQGLATLSLNLGNLQDAEKYFQEALSHLDGMTERERYNTRGVYYRLTGDFKKCETEYTDLIARFDGDVLAHNNLALCATLNRNMPKALSEMRRALEILPKRAVYHVNLALYASYGGDFQTGEQEAHVAQELASPLTMLPLAFAQTAQERLADAAESYRNLGKVESLGPAAASWEASGLADLAIYEGRFSEAVKLLESGAAADLTAKNADRAAAKLAAAAYAHLSRGQKAAAIAAADKALATSKAVKIRFLAGRILIESGQVARGRTVAAELAAEKIQDDPQAHAKILEGLAALASNDRRQAIKTLAEANTIVDTWIGHFDLGRAYLAAGQFPEADSEFDRCLKRRGEALSLFLDEEPTFGYLPAAYYYKGRVRQELKNAGFAEAYNTYLGIRGKSTEDPLVPDVRKRVGAQRTNP